MSDGMHVEGPQVLMVDDEKKVADAYALRLDGVADVTVAYGGEEALDKINEQPAFDVILLDRHMPDLSGDEVLERVRERDIDTRVIMVTAVDPDLSVLDMPFDDYLAKPVEREDLHAAVDEQCLVLAYDLLGEYFSLESTRAVVQSELQAEDDESQSRLEEIEDRLETTEQRVRSLLPEAEELLSQFSGIDRQGY